MATMEQAVELLENRGWNIEFYDDYTYLGWCSPKGEDWSFETYEPLTSVEDFRHEIFTEYMNFDVDEHVDLWAPGRGTNGVPSTYSSLVHDAEAIETELYEASNELAHLNRE